MPLINKRIQPNKQHTYLVKREATVLSNTADSWPRGDVQMQPARASPIPHIGCNYAGSSDRKVAFRHYRSSDNAHGASELVQMIIIDRAEAQRVCSRSS